MHGSESQTLNAFDRSASTRSRFERAASSASLRLAASARMRDSFFQISPNSRTQNSANAPTPTFRPDVWPASADVKQTADISAKTQIKSRYGAPRTLLDYPLLVESPPMTRSTTVIGVLRDGNVAVAADGQVTLSESTIIKSTARKVRRLGSSNVIAGFAGSVADAQALQERFETKLDQFKGSLLRAAVEFAKEWRTDKVLRNLNAMMVVAEHGKLLVVSGDGNVLEPDDGVAGIGSGGAFAMAAACALLRYTNFSAEQIAQHSLQIASEICVYTNDKIVIETA